MSGRMLALLGLVLAGLVAAELLPGRSTDSGGEARPLLALADAADARALTVTAGPDELRLRRDPAGRWVDARGASSATRDRLVDSLLSALATTPRGRGVRVAGVAETYGLGATSIRVVLDASDTEHALRFGDVTPLGDSVYARDERDAIDAAFLAPRGLRALLVEAATKWSRVAES